MAQYVKAIAAAEVEPGQGKLVELQGRKIALFNVGGSYYAIDDTCTHRGGPLSEGKFDGEKMTCPWHGSQFAIEDGEVVVGPATYRQPCFEVRVRNGEVQLRAPRGMVANPY